jgi:hypothetical protein
MFQYIKLSIDEDIWTFLGYFFQKLGNILFNFLVTLARWRFRSRFICITNEMKTSMQKKLIVIFSPKFQGCFSKTFLLSVIYEFFSLV